KDVLREDAAHCPGTPARSRSRHVLGLEPVGYLVQRRAIRSPGVHLPHHGGLFVVDDERDPDLCPHLHADILEAGLFGQADAHDFVTLVATGTDAQVQFTLPGPVPPTSLHWRTGRLTSAPAPALSLLLAHARQDDPRR